MSSPPIDDPFAAGLRRFGPPGLLAIAAILLTGNVFLGSFVLPLGGILVLLWARLSSTPLRELGYSRPKSWTLTIALGIALGVVLKFVMKAIVMPLLGAPAINPTYHYLAGNTAALPAAIWAMFAAAGFGEETVFRGFAFERLRKLLGSSAWAKTFTVLVTAAAFGAAHYSNQGMPGVQQAAIVGLVLGSIFALSGRLWLPIIAHIAFDLTALAMIYWNLEWAVAHLVFK
jgi:uncharacterized protein